MRSTKEYERVYRNIINDNNLGDADELLKAYLSRLNAMYASEQFKKHNVYPTMNVETIYAVIAMCLELKKFGLSDQEIIDAVDRGYEPKRKKFKNLIKCINLLPNSYNIAKRWNLSDHAKRVEDGSITYDNFDVSDNKVEYYISRCMYVEMFECYGIRPLCKIFCNTDVMAYEGLTRHVEFIRHSDLSDGPACYDEVIRK